MCQETEIRSPFPCRRDGFPEDVGCPVAVGIDVIPHAAAVQAAFHPASGKMVLYSILLPVDRDEIPCGHIRPGSIGLFLFDDLDPGFPCLVCNQLLQLVVGDPGEVLVVCLPDVYLLLPSLVGTDDQDPGTVVHAVLDDPAANLMCLVLQETVPVHTELVKVRGLGIPVVVNTSEGTLSNTAHIISVNGMERDILSETTYHKVLPASVSVHKYGPDEDFLPGAVLAILDSEGNEVARWETTGEADLVGLPSAGDYVLHEVSAPAGYLPAEDITFNVSSRNILVVNGSIVPYLSMVDKIAAPDLSVSKTVAGNMGSKTKQFSFTLKLENPGGTLPDTLDYEKGADTGTVAAVTQGEYQFTLAHGETITFKEIPSGATYEVTETDAASSGYTVTSEHATGTIADSDVDVSFTNTRNLSIPTDAHSSGWTGMATTLLLLALLFFHSRRKHSRT